MPSAIHGLSVIIGADAGVDIVAVNRAVNAKPMSLARGRSLVAYAIKLLTLANDNDQTGKAGLAAQRTDLIRQLQHIDSSLKTATIDPLPETGAQNSPAGILRAAVLEAVAQFNQVAEGNATLERARDQIFPDMVENAKQLATSVTSGVSGVLWYTRTTYWALIGAGVLLVGLLGWGVSAGVRSRIAAR